jgi:hypothetical protein
MLFCLFVALIVSRKDLIISRLSLSVSLMLLLRLFFLINRPWSSPSSSFSSSSSSSDDSSFIVLFLRLSGVGVCEVVVTSGAPCYGRLLKSGHYREGFSVQDICRGGLLCLVALIRKSPSFIEAAEVLVV